MRTQKTTFLLLNSSILVAMLGLYFLSPRKTEQTIRYVCIPPKVPISVLYCSVQLRDNSTAGVGSGFIVSENAVMTCEHVISSVGIGGTVWADWYDESGKHSSVMSVVKGDKARDTAILVLTDKTIRFEHHAIISRATPQYGDRVICVGGPQGHFLAPFDGVFVKREETGGFDMIVGPCMPGHSGGPIFDVATGEVIGMASRLYGFSEMNNVPIMQTHAFKAVPNNWMIDFLKENGF